MFLNHVDERRSAVIAVRSDSPSGSGVRLEPRGDRFGRRHESFAVRHRLTDQRLVAGPLRAAKSHARQPDSIDSRCQRHDHDESVLAVFSGLGNYRRHRRRWCWLSPDRHRGQSLVCGEARTGTGDSWQRQLHGPAHLPAAFYGDDYLCRLAHGIDGPHRRGDNFIAADLRFHAGRSV